MQTLDFEKNENGNVMCDGNGNPVQGFSQINPFQMKTVAYHCEKHGDVPCNVLIMNGVPGEPYCPICEKEKERRLEEQQEKERKEKELQEKIQSYKSMNIENEFWGKTIDDYQPLCEAQQKAKDAVKRMIERRRGKVILLGNNGAGKSHLGNAAVSALGGKVLTIYEINAMIRQSYSALAKQTELEIVQELSSVPMLFLDEFGRTKGSKFEMDWLSFVLDKRHQRGLPFMLASNGHLKRDCPHGKNYCENCFENYLGEDILSRLRQDTEVVTLYDAPDYRRRK